MNDRVSALIEPWRANLAAWYGARQPNEQRLLRMAAIVVPLLIVLSLVTGLHGAVTRLEKRVSTKRADLAYLKSALPALANAPHPNASGGSLVALVDSSSREAGLVVSGTEPQGANQLKVRLDAAPFDTVIGWLVRLQQTEGVAVAAASIDRAAGPGQVNATLTLSRP